MAKEQYMDLLREILKETDWNYGSIYPDGDEYNDEVFIYEGYKPYTVESLNELCKAKLKENGIDTYPDHTYDYYYIDFITGDNWGFYDSYFICNDCYKAYRYNEYGTANYWVGDGFIICEDCVRKNYKEEYIEYLINEPTYANTLIPECELEDMGFEKVNEYTYENGMYGTNDNPTDIYSDLLRIYPNSEIIFHIYDVNPFAVYFDVYVRKADEDIEDRYMKISTGEVMNYEQMKEYCKENYDYGDETNFVTYMSEWWKECGFKKIA